MNRKPPDGATRVHRGWLARAPLGWRLSIVTGVVVTASVSLMTLLAFLLVSTAMTGTIDRNLNYKADTILRHISSESSSSQKLVEDIQDVKDFNDGVRLRVRLSQESLWIGDDLPLDGEFKSNPDGSESAAQTVGDERVFAKRQKDGTAVVVAQDLEHYQSILTALATALIVIVAVGIVLAAISGMVVARTGLQPIRRLKKAADDVTLTGDLNPIPVVGSDEMAQLTVSFNEMMSTLRRLRVQQAQFVADAGHELKTPLTSMRTNIELLLLVNRADSATTISDSDRAELEADVMAQISELSTLIGDLVDLAREDSMEQDPETVLLHEVVAGALQRARRRRPDVAFLAWLQPWELQGDAHALSRAILNILDNAAKWSKPEDAVKVEMREQSEGCLRLCIDDSGPGIPESERERVFERFYRTADARSMPGSGLGLAIAKQVVERHHASIEILTSPTGGTRIQMDFPGSQAPGGPYTDGYVEGLDPDDGALGEQVTAERRRIFAERWLKQE